MNRFRCGLAILLSALFLFPMTPGCGQKGGDPPALDVPRGYVAVIETELDDRLFGFGPFVGYYFMPEDPDDLSRLKFLCFNERSFYTGDMPVNAKLFEGDAILTRLADTGIDIPDADRINPIFFPDAPPEWLANRPKPRDEYVHFHSCYDSGGPVLAGYWIRHKALAAFVYDMGGRVGPDSPLWHKAKPGIDKDFAQIVEFDRGPE